MKLIKDGKFYIVFLEKFEDSKQTPKRKLKFWNNKRWRYNNIKKNK